jgi:hypothetical protein
MEKAPFQPDKVWEKSEGKFTSLSETCYRAVAGFLCAIDQLGQYK